MRPGPQVSKKQFTMEAPKGENLPRRVPFTEIQNVQAPVQAQYTGVKTAPKPPLSNKARAIEKGRQTLAAFKERRERALARRADAKTAAAAYGPSANAAQPPAACANLPPDTAAPPLRAAPQAPGAAAAGAQSSLRVSAQTPSKIPAPARAPARDAPRISAPIPTKMPSPTYAKASSAPRSSVPTPTKILSPTQAKVSAPRSSAPTPTKIPSPTYAKAGKAPRSSATTPTKIPSPPAVHSRENATKALPRALQTRSMPVSPDRQVTAASARPYSAHPTPNPNSQVPFIQMGLCGSQRNPLFDEGAVAQGQEQSLISTSALTPAIIPTHTRNPAAEVMQRGKWVPSRGISACSGYVLAADSAAGLSVRSSADGTVMGGSGPHSGHSMGSGLSRSGSITQSTLSVLYENQAMKMERQELKSELKLISARLAVLEARSKGWGRVGQPPKGRSQSAPRGVPRSRVASLGAGAAGRPAPVLAQHAEPERTGRLQQKVSRPQPTLPSNTTAPAAPKVRAAVSRPSSPRPAKGASFGSSRASSPARQRRAAVFGSRAASPARAHAKNVEQKGTRSPPAGASTPARGGAPQLAFGSRAGSPMSKGAQRQNRKAAPPGSGQPEEPMQQGGSANQPPPASMPYRNAFMGGQMFGTRRVIPTKAAAAQPAAAAAAAAAEGGAKPDLAMSGPPAPPAGAVSAACPSSVERWAGPGGRLGRTKLTRQTPRKESRQSLREDKENAAENKVQPSSKVSKLALTAAKLGLEHAFKPRHA